MKRILLTIIAVVTAVLGAYAVEHSPGRMPRWITSELPRPSDPDCYSFFRAEGFGSSPAEASMNAFINLTKKIETERGLVVEKALETYKEFSSTSGSKKDKKMKISVIEKGQHISLICSEVDDYWVYKDGRYQMWILYTVNNTKKPTEGSSIDNIRVTPSYGAAPVFYSLIPGVGQMYKGSTVKGGIILGSAVVVGAGIITAESLRASYIKKMKEYPKHHDFYNNKATTWKNIRNVTIGVGAGLYLYNLIDAAVASGRPRVIVTPKRSYYYSLAPTWDGESVGLAFNLTF